MTPRELELLTTIQEFRAVGKDISPFVAELLRIRQLMGTDQ
jgi:hypothetical protein